MEIPKDKEYHTAEAKQEIMNANEAAFRQEFYNETAEHAEGVHD